MLRSVLALVLPLALAACSLLPVGTPARLAGTSWKAVAFSHAGLPQTAPDGPGYTLAFGTDGQATGMGDCNRYFGSFAVTAPDSLAFGSLGSTRMACPEGAAEAAFLQGLGAVRTYALDGRTLTLRTAAGETLTFRRR